MTKTDPVRALRAFALLLSLVAWFATLGAEELQRQSSLVSNLLIMSLVVLFLVVALAFYWAEVGLIGLTVIAAGTSLPEVATSVLASLRRDPQGRVLPNANKDGVLFVAMGDEHALARSGDVDRRLADSDVAEVAVAELSKVRIMVARDIDDFRRTAGDLL